MRKRDLAKQVAIRITPYVPLKRYAASIGQSFASMGETFRAYGKVLRRRWDRVSEGLPAADAAARFEQLYEENGWDERTLAGRAGSLRVTRFIFLMLGGLCLPLVLLIFLKMPFWISSFLGPMCMAFAVVLFGMAARYGWWEYQIETRQMTGFKAFVGRDDFWRRLFT